jgi:hypothetical protein
MAYTRPWADLDRTLAIASGDDFARKVRPLLRLLWPTLVETPRKRKWDNDGIDYVAWVDDGPFPCVVQCKGFEVQVLGKSQLEQIEKSVAKFGKSGNRCDEYVLVHNRDGRDRDFFDQASTAVASLVTAGCALRARVLDRQGLRTEVYAALRQHVEDAARRATQKRTDRLRLLFDLAPMDPLMNVPATTGTIQLRALAPLQIRLEASSRMNPSEFILHGSARRWTLMEGMFGAGKTTATLAAASAANRVVVYVPCADIPETGSLSLRQLLEAAVTELEVFAAAQDETDRSLVQELAGAMLVALLSGDSKDNRYLLVFDGLDENRRFGTADGLTKLVNQLEPIECPVVVTTRSEHFSALFGTFSSALGELSHKLGANPTLDLLRLDPWTVNDAAEAVGRAAQRAPPLALAHLIRLRAKLLDGSYAAEFGDLPTNPLMLQFLIEDVAAGDLGRVTSATLIGRWLLKKFWRDSERRKVLLGDALDTAVVVERTAVLMEQTALAMTVRNGEQIELSEQVSSDVVQTLAAVLFPHEADPIVGVAVNTALVPVDRRRGAAVQLTFALRIFQEYFVAAALRRTAQQPTAYPQSVQILWRELDPPDSV